MRIQLTAAALIASLSLAACANDPYGRPYGQNGRGGISKSDVGTLLGAGAGAVLGSNIGKGKGNVAAIAVGTLLGAGLGNSIGASLDRADMQYYDRASQNALETAPVGQRVEWRNPDSGNYGYITPTQTYETANTVCREYSQTIYVGGRSEQGYGKACRQADGSWKIVQ